MLLQKRIVIKKDGVISAETEYNALREEKIFRYQYSNQLNTNLLTFALTVFTAGLIIFTLMIEFGGVFNSNESDSSNQTFDLELITEKEGTQYSVKITESHQQQPIITKRKIYAVFIEYFFAAFFLFPCYFSAISFTYCLRNSLRIATLSEHIRRNVTFNQTDSWEIVKQKYNIHYFYNDGYGIGGAKDIPTCICSISSAISIALGLFFAYLNFDFGVSYWYWIVRGVMISLCVIVLQFTYLKRVKYGYFLVFFINIVVNLYFMAFGCLKPICTVTGIIQMGYTEFLSVTVFFLPQFKRDTLIANCMIKINQLKIEKYQNTLDNTTIKQIIDESVQESRAVIKIGQDSITKSTTKLLNSPSYLTNQSTATRCYSASSDARANLP